MKSVVALSLLAGAACALPAMAQQDTLVPAGQAMRVPARCLSMPTREFTPRDVQSVYEVTNPDGGVFTNTALPKQLLDDCSLVPGPASNGTFPMLVTGMFVSFAVSDPVVDFDVEVTFWDGVDVAAPAQSPVHINQLDGFVVGITGLGGPGAYVTDWIDLTGLPNGGISLPDAGTFVRVRYLNPGTTDLVTGAVQIVYDNTNDINTFAATTIGTTDINTWRDVDADGIIEAAEARSFAYPGRGALWIGMQADVPSAGNPSCSQKVDFNGDGFVDFFDYDDFVNAFENGC